MFNKVNKCVLDIPNTLIHELGYPLLIKFAKKKKKIINSNYHLFV